MKSSLGVALASLVLLAAGRASAQTCKVDADCPQGHTCKSETVVQPEPAVDCKPGAPDCVRPDASAPTTMVISYCQARSCSADADCGAGMICHAETIMECSGGSAVACPRDQPCDAGPPVKMEPMCTSHTVKTCAFKWQLPCNAASDCGDGFTCKPTEIGSCSGSAPSTGGGSSGSGGAGGGARVPAPPSDGGAAPPPQPPMCTTTTTYPGYCAPTVTSCSTDADCPALWKCMESPETAVGSGTTTPEGRPGFVPPPPPDAGPAKKVCVSTLGGFPVGVGRDEKGQTTSPTPGGGGSTSGPMAPPGAPPTGDATADAGASAGTPKGTGSGGGCTVGGAGASGAGLLLMAILGLALGRRRSRR